MKKLILTVALATAMFAKADIDLSAYTTLSEVKAAYAAAEGRARWEYLKSLSDETKAAYFVDATNALEAVIASGNFADVPKIVMSPLLFSTMWATHEDLLALDAKLNNAGVIFFQASVEGAVNAPMLHATALAQDSSLGLWRRRNYTVFYTTATNGTFYTQNIPAVANRLVEQIASYSLKTDEIPEKIKSLCNKVVPAVKMALRKQGKTFIVGDDGVNPVQDAVDALTDAFQSPKCAGVKEWIATYYPEYTWVDPVVEDLTDEQITELTDKVFYGQIELNNVNSTKLLYFLGLDAYNTFIDRYNK